MSLSGVDVSDPNRSFTDAEYQKLQDNGHWPIVMHMRKTDDNSRGGGPSNNSNLPREVSGVSQQSQISQVTDEQSTNQNQQQQQQRQGGGSDRGGTNGTGFGSGAYQN